jgi:hypothetical protein
LKYQKKQHARKPALCLSGKKDLRLNSRPLLISEHTMLSQRSDALMGPTKAVLSPLCELSESGIAASGAVHD